MPSTPSPLLRLELQTTGENNNSWGVKLNNGAVALLEEAVAGRANYTLSGPKTLTSTNYATDESRKLFQDITGGTGGTITIPAVSKFYVFRNNSSGTVIVTTGSGATASIAAGLIAYVACDGTNVYVDNAATSAAASAVSSAASAVLADNDRIAAAVSAAAAAASAAALGTAAAHDILFVFDGGGAALVAGKKADVAVDFNCTVEGWTLLADQSGSAVVDVWVDAYANYPPTVADSKAGSEKPTISAATKAQDNSLTTWTTAIAAGSIIRANIDSATTVQRLTLALKVRKT